MSREYALGRGKVAVSVTQHKKLPKVYVYFEHLLNSFNVGDDILRLNPETVGETMRLQFTSIESINVVELALGKAKELLQIKLKEKDK